MLIRGKLQAETLSSGHAEGMLLLSVYREAYCYCCDSSRMKLKVKQSYKGKRLREVGK